MFHNTQMKYDDISSYRRIEFDDASSYSRYSDKLHATEMPKKCDGPVDQAIVTDVQWKPEGCDSSPGRICWSIGRGTYERS